MGKAIAPEIRFWRLVERVPFETCWLWVGTLNNHGYGMFRLGTSAASKKILAHRFAFEVLRGPIPTGMALDHLCRTPWCVNPSHLEVVTHAENTRRGHGISTVHARKTSCVNGHAFDDANTYLRKTGGRRCRTCDRGRHRKVA